MKKHNCIFCGKTQNGKRKLGERWYCCDEHHEADKKRVHNEAERQKHQ